MDALLGREYTTILLERGIFVFTRTYRDFPVVGCPISASLEL